MGRNMPCQDARGKGDNWGNTRYHSMTLASPYPERAPFVVGAERGLFGVVGE